MGISVEQLAMEFPELTCFELLGRSQTKIALAARHASAGPSVLKIRNPRRVNARCDAEAVALTAAVGESVPRLIMRGEMTTAGGRCSYTSETRVAGQSVHALREAGPLKLEDTLSLGRAVLEVLTRLERAGLAHRDIKPKNVIRSDDGKFHVIDFDLAFGPVVSNIDDPAAFARRMTFAYAAPERIGSLQPTSDVRSDLFSLGVSLHECLTGENGFRNGTQDDDELLRRVREVELPAVDNSLAPTPVAAWINRLTAKRVDERPLSAAHALDELNSLM